MYVYHPWCTYKCMYVWTTRLSLVHPLISHHHLGPHVCQPRFPPPIVRRETEDSVETEKFWEKCIFLGKISWLRTEGTYTTPGGSMGRGREWELPETYRNANTIPVTSRSVQEFRTGNRKVFRIDLSQKCSERSQPFPHMVLWTG